MAIKHMAISKRPQTNYYITTETQNPQEHLLSILVPKLGDLRLAPRIPAHPVESAKETPININLINTSIHPLTSQSCPAPAQSPRRA